MQYTPPPNTGQNIVYQDRDLLVVNKPSGLLSVPGRGEARQDCQSARVQQDYPGALVVHRLDMSTSGLLLMAKNKAAQTAMAGLFERRRIEKTYVAVVAGIPRHGCGEIDLPLISDWPNRPRQKVDFDNGKRAVTQYRVIGRSDDKRNSRLCLKPLTGRSHQLRVHLQAIGHPILGDELYADPNTRQDSPRLLLHALGLCFNHPGNGKRIEIVCPVPF